MVSHQNLNLARLPIPPCPRIILLCPSIIPSFGLGRKENFAQALLFFSKSRILYKLPALAPAAVSRNILTLNKTNYKERTIMSNKTNVRFLALSAVIAALYAALTYAAAMLNLAYGPVQLRFSEALTVLPAFTPAAIPGLAVGCLIANLGSPLGMVDWVFGTAATLLAALGTAAVSKIQYKGLPLLAPLPPVILNALVVGLEISCLNGDGAFTWSAFTLANFGYSALTVGLGELAVCLVLGLPLVVLLEKAGLRKMLAASQL